MAFRPTGDHVKNKNDGEHPMEAHVSGHLNFRRFIVLTRSRTGSNMLISFLNSHPHIYAEGEIFNRLHGRNHLDILSRAYGEQAPHIKAKGFKIFYYHPLDDPTSQVWDSLMNLDPLWVIHLKRRNILRTLVSRKIAGLRDVWTARSDEGRNLDSKKAVTFTVQDLDEGFKQTREWEIEGEKKFEKDRLISVYYEDLISNPESTFKQITDFLGVEYVTPKTILRKQNPESLKKLITNYNELKNAFSETEWQPFFKA
jgi:LPS sulfotransferase NodH